MTQDPDSFADPKTNTAKEIDYRQQLADYIDRSVGTPVQKMMNFTKYIPRQAFTRVLGRYEIFKQVLDVHGSVIECGVLLGGGLMSYAQFSAILEPVNYTRRIIGFDTFQGFVNLDQRDMQGDVSSFAKEGGLAVDSYTDIQEAVRLYDQNRTIGHIPKVELVRGDILETVPRYVEQNPQLIVSLLYLDVDVLEPTRTALEYFVPRMPKGAIIAFDELNAAAWPGETIATLETLGIHNLRLRRFPWDTFLSYAVIE